MWADDLPVSVPAQLRRACDEAPEREAVVGRSGRITYRELDEAVGSFAAELQRHGLRAGDRLAVSIPNDLDIILSFHAAARLGAIWVGVARKLAPPEKAFILNDAGACLFLSDQSGLRDLRALDLRTTTIIELESAGESWRSPSDDMITDAANVTPESPIGIAYTSGTTGFPKGAVLSHRNVLTAAAALAATRDYPRGKMREGVCLPLTNLNSQVLNSVLMPIVLGCTVAIDRIDPEGLAEWIAKEKVTHTHLVPTTIHGLTHSGWVSRAQLTTLEEVVAGGASVSAELLEEFEDLVGLRPVVGYGLTEAPAVLSVGELRKGDPPGSTGRPLPHLNVTIEDTEGRELVAGQTGEICVQPRATGPLAGVYTTMLGYWGDAVATEQAIGGGKLRTGDLGYLDDNGRLVVRDRMKSVIIRGGQNIYPAEVERVLLGDRRIADCVVVGIADERLGECVAAVLEFAGAVRPSDEEVRAWCSTQLAPYKVPDHFAFVEELPRNSFGKILRVEAEQLAREMLAVTIDYTLLT